MAAITIVAALAIGTEAPAGADLVPLPYAKPAQLAIPPGTTPFEWLPELALDIDGATAVVGVAPLTDGSPVGNVFVYTRNVQFGTWSVQAELSMPVDVDPGPGTFGASVAVDGNTIVVGRPGRLEGDPGSAFVYVRSGSTWSLQAQWTEPNGFFGKQVGIDGDRIAVAGPSGVTAFVRSGATWSVEAGISIPADSSDLFGAAIALSGTTLLVGAPERSIDPDQSPGAAYAYVKSGASWALQAKLTGSGTAFGDEFGKAVALDGNTAIVGAPLADTSLTEEQGAAYAFERSGATWTEQDELVVSELGSFGRQGISVAVEGDRALIGTNSSWAWVYDRSDGTWTERGSLRLCGSGHINPGRRVAISSDRMLMGTSSLASYVFEGLNDCSPPVVNVVLSPAPPDGDDGWYRSNVTGFWAISDLSPWAVDDGCNVIQQSLDTAPGGTTHLCEATSVGGTTSKSITLKRDGTKPSITATVIPAAPDGTEGWYVTAPTVTFGCTDPTPGSGLATCTAPKTLGSSDLPQSAGGVARDVAGNEAVDAISSLDVDLEAPTVTCATPVPTIPIGKLATVGADVTDAHSGPIKPVVEELVDTSTIGSFTVPLKGADHAGWTTVAECPYKVFDDSPPVVTLVLSPPVPDGTNGWYRTDIAVTWNVSDPESPDISTTGCHDTTIDLDTSTVGLPLLCIATSDGGTTTVTKTVRRDAEPPLVVPTTTPSQPDGLGGWYITAPTVSFYCADDIVLGSGILSCSGPTTLGSAASPQVVTGTAVDIAGNAGSTSAGPLKVDLLPPAVTCGATPSLVYGHPGPVSATVTDPHSGPAAATVSVSADTTAVGMFSATLTGADQAGHMTTASCPYIVVKAPTTLIAHPAVAQLAPMLKVNLAPSATLIRSDTLTPLAGQVVMFKTGSAVVCQAVTDAAGLATCSGVGSLLQVVLNLGYQAVFAGTAGLLPSSSTGTLL